MDFSNKKVLVVGGTGGIGAEIVKGIALRGGNVVFTYNKNADRAKELVSICSEYKGKTSFEKVDLMNKEKISSLVDKVSEKLGGLDIFISTVGYTHRMISLVEQTDEDIDKVLDLELRSVIYLAKKIFSKMIDHQKGHIVFVGSDSGKVGITGMSISAAARGGLNAFAKSLAREGARHQITVNVVCPGPTDDEAWEDLKEQDEYTSKICSIMEKSIPIKRLPKPAEVAAVSIFLASDLSGSVTGQTISASGGLTMS